MSDKQENNNWTWEAKWLMVALLLAVCALTVNWGCSVGPVGGVPTVPLPSYSVPEYVLEIWDWQKGVRMPKENLDEMANELGLDIKGEGLYGTKDGSRTFKSKELLLAWRNGATSENIGTVRLSKEAGTEADNFKLILPEDVDRMAVNLGLTRITIDGETLYEHKLGKQFRYNSGMVIYLHQNKQKHISETEELAGWSHPVYVNEYDDGKFTDATIHEMAKDLNLIVYREGQNKYFQNDFGLIYTPNQVPTLHLHKTEYEKEMLEWWKDLENEKPKEWPPADAELP